jgi:transglutaminase-like putative cysteine protease
MEYTVEHVTNYHYERPVTESYTVVHLQPQTTLRQYCTRFELDVRPHAHVFTYRDRFGNDVQHFSIVPEHDELRIVARSHVVTVGGGPVLIPHAVSEQMIASDARTASLFEFLQPSPYVALGDEVERFAADEVDADASDRATFFLAAGRRVHASFAYEPGTTTVQTTVAEALRARAGVCQDFAHVLIAVARSRGIPTRYASGYVFRGVDAVLGADASHAWAEAYLPPYGWVGFDPTNDRIVDDGFVLVAVGRDYGDVSPTRGLYRGRTPSELEVSVAVGAGADQ